MTVFATNHGEAMKRLKWVALGICLLIAAWNINAYRLGVEGRASVQRWTYKNSPDGRYTLAYGTGLGNWIWVRLRRSGETEVLADRWFESTEPNWVFWDADHVSYSRYDATGPIHLPPNWLDNWLAKLP
ncbi:hypothetical protein H7F36_04370 [Variovorax sp. PAMC28562]|uniref:hypothetical protein n=1 Tax=Variovorax sp. PAMC28562 TaxID=2762323 RepID=UPI00164DDC1F|nr:hypothetical protein [Variovorax sp. PAMC28562]QNK74478.1 hypothetical protein H7F36_04370 [Variovorax sp. PAMC28562]